MRRLLILAILAVMVPIQVMLEMVAEFLDRRL
jgi:hypothetical protein